LERGKQALRFPNYCSNFYPQAKKAISLDPRYDAVGSSSLREELFNTFSSLQANRTVADPTEKPAVDIASADRADETQKRKDRKANAVKEREEKIKAERDRLQANIEKSRVDLNKEEGESQFRCATATCFSFPGRVLALTVSLSIPSRCRTLLTDAIREPQVRAAFYNGQRSDHHV